MKGIAVVLGLAAVTSGIADRASDALRFNYFVNDWNVVGLKDYDDGARVTPDAAILLSGKNAIRVHYGVGMKPLAHSDERSLEDGWMPVIHVAAKDKAVRYEFTYWATPMPTLKDWRKAFDWPTEGDNFLVWVAYKAVNRSKAPAKAVVDVNVETASNSNQATYRGLQRGVEELAPGASFEGAISFPFFPIQNPESLERLDWRTWLGRTIGYWRGVAAEAASITVPEAKVNDALLFAHVTQLIAMDHGVVKGGEGFYDEFYIRDGAYQILELEEAGLFDLAKKALESYPGHQLPEGRFESQSRQWDANGQAQWALWQYFAFTRDAEWLGSAYPAMKRGAEWTMKARREAPSGPRFAGLLPVAPADGEFLWDGKHHIVGYDLWNLRGMLCTASAARALGKTEDADALEKEAAAYRAAIEAAWKAAGVPYFPPSWEGVGTDWGNLEELWPTPLFAANDPRVASNVQRVRKDSAEGIMKWNGQRDVIHPYAGSYAVMSDLVKGNDANVVEDFYWYLLHSSSTHAFPEGIYYKRNMAWGDTIPHVTGAANYAFLLRHMLVHEQGNELHLLKAVPDGWLADGKEIRIERLPTTFGTLNLTIRGRRAGVEVTIDPPKRNPPARIVLHLPSNRPLLHPVAGLAVVTRKPQTARWDFAGVVARYREVKIAEAKDTTGKEMNLTTGKPASCSSGSDPDLANDGVRTNPDAYWSTDVQRQNDPQPWWQVDLQKPATVGRIIVVPYYGDKRYYGFVVSLSNDGKNWTTVADRSANTDLATVKGHTCTFPPRKARYIRVTMSANSANTGRHLVEVLAYPK
ncbi:MAG: discoidin domain-containing protein [Fimbriimonadales bacterium]